MTSQIFPTCSNNPNNIIIDVHHFPDNKIFLTPDLYAKEEPGSYPSPKEDQTAAKDYYTEKFNDFLSNRVGGHQYVKHSYYKNVRDCFPDAYCIDATIIDENEQIMLHIVTKGDNLNQVVEQTTVKIQRSKSQMWNWVKNVSKHDVDKLLHKKDKVYAVHDELLTKDECIKAKMPHRFEGAMYAIGKHVDHYSKTES